jgi:hypothetical protein
MPIPRRFARYIVLALSGTVLIGYQPAQAQLNQHRREAIKPYFEEGLVPLFVLGDLDEDGTVDRKDRDLLAELIRHPSSHVASCPAAGDLDFNFKLNQDDLDRFDDWLAKGGVQTPALTFQPTLPCQFKHLIVAARFDASPGETVPIRFLDERLNTSNSRATIESGPASVEAASDHKGFIVTPATAAKTGDVVTVLLNLRGHEYFYTFRLTP